MCFSGLRVVDKQPYNPPRSALKRPPDAPNLHLVELLVKGYSPYIHSLSEDDLIHAATATEGTYLYCYNISIDHLAPDFTGYLYEDVVIRASNVDPSKNRLIAECPGINKPFIYISSQLAFGEMHIEDAHLGSFNVVLMNLPPLSQDLGSKFWIFVTDGQKLTRVVQEKYRLAGIDVCPFILHHKTTFISTKFLKINQIPCTTLIQKPGDVVYVRPGVFHSVINITPNLAEAINYGDARWNEFADLLITCGCADNHYATFSSNPDCDNIITSRQPPAYPCQERNCEFFSRDYPSYLTHIASAHN
ncbi:hypothetical protein QAD02_021226 [Eretmocerus hayati]|uniref:Uncharacterized protein n=2 Tax=Eretmocerus hayati TaxID=131215 RepID=A0ACC2PPN4_9HYME|nr:hypothetical protein QAD02_021225 [Eretmocerus hayati]KAJ8685433.1 hypothetical protein QAD02_021226 [Eretmocerus hayati]